MTKTQIIENIYKDGIIKSILDKYNNEIDINKKDLEQDIYILLFQLPVEILQEMHSNGKLKNWLSATIKNQIYSTTSFYYYQYKKFDKITNEYTESII